MGTKNEPGKYDCYAKLEPDEPYFLLRGKDPVAWLLVDLWCSLRKAMAGDDFSPAYVEKLNEAKSCAESMKLYATTHPANVGARTVLAAIDAFKKLRRMTQ